MFTTVEVFTLDFTVFEDLTNWIVLPLPHETFFLLKLPRFYPKVLFMDVELKTPN